MKVFSFSRLSTFENCPYSFYKKYVEEIKGQPTEALLLGKACHAVIEMALKKRATHESFFKTAAELIAAMEEIEADQIFNLTYQSIVLQYIQKTETKTEEHFIFPLNSHAELQGYIDLYIPNNDHIELIDWKTNRAEYLPQDTHQLGLYAHYLIQKYQKPVVGKLVFLRTGKEKVQVYNKNVVEPALEWALRTTQQIQSALEKCKIEKEILQYFPRREGTVCQYCEFAVECTRSEYNPREIRNQKEALRVAQELFKLEAAISSLKENLKAWVKTHGPVRVDDKEYKFAPSKYWKWPAQSLHRAVEEMEKEGIDPFTVLSLTSTGLKKLKWDEEKIESLGANLRETQNFKCVKTQK